MARIALLLRLSELYGYRRCRRPSKASGNCGLSRGPGGGLWGCLAAWLAGPGCFPGASRGAPGRFWGPPGGLPGLPGGGAGGVWGSPGGPWGGLGGVPGLLAGIWGPLGGFLGGSGGLLAAFWVGLGASWGPPWTGPGASWGVLGASWGAPGRPGWPLGAHLGRSEAFLNGLGASLPRNSKISFPPRRERHLWASEGLVLGFLGASRGFLGAS